MDKELVKKELAEAIKLYLNCEDTGGEFCKVGDGEFICLDTKRSLEIAQSLIDDGWGKIEDYKEALEDMVWQFAYRFEDGTLRTGGLSALESAFQTLGWKDPYKIKDCNGVICDVDGCCGFVSCQGCAWRETGYWCLCSEHCAKAINGQPQPKMKRRALDREASRDKTTGILKHNTAPRADEEKSN